MCRPTFYGVEYEINPWMDVRRQPDRPLALAQWQALRRVLVEKVGATVHLCRPRPGLPDMAFTANAGLVRGRTFIPSRFRYPEREGEAPYFAAWFRRRGFRVVPLPDDRRFEGAGDALFVGDRLFAGYYFRTDLATHEVLGRLLGLKVFSLHLVDRYFYHLDTCFMPFGPHSALYYPAAFDRYSRTVLHRNIPDLIPIGHGEARQFACNSVLVGREAVIPAGCPRVSRALEVRGYAVHPVEVSEFIKAGGAAKCLVLRLR
jgi:N-dimethylarginine dimethylaminohydrolase